MKHCLVWLLILSGTAHAVEVYISRDTSGNIVFSDQPNATSQRHTVKELPSVPAVAAASVSMQQPAQASTAAFTYTSLSIVTPTNGQSIPPGYASNVEVSGVLSPGLRESDTIFLLDNGTVIRQGRQTTFQLTDLFRGEHQLQIVVRDSQGKTLISSNPVTIFVHRPSVIHRP